jgi:hypothetical protein
VGVEVNDQQVCLYSVITMPVVLYVGVLLGWWVDHWRGSVLRQSASGAVVHRPLQV